jgi:hypothetical protein
MTWRIFANHLREGDTISLPSPLGGGLCAVQLSDVHKGGHFVYFQTQAFGHGKLPLSQEVELLAEEPE